MRYRILSPAEDELREAVEYYNTERPGLGLEFAVEARATIHRILAHPDAWPQIEHNLRRCLLVRFPYSILYQIVAHELIVVAFMHHKRRPLYWRKRMR